MSEEKMYGWMGAVLRVDLTREKVTKQPLDREVAAKFIGGRGLNSKVLFDEIRPGIDPLGPENVLCLATGPLTGTPLALSSRLELSTLSPYSYILGDGSAGGFFPAAMKFAGYDQIVITGRSSAPKYLWIDDGAAELRDASDLWGKTTWETTNILQKKLGKDVKVACIGQAGENLVRAASTIFDKYHSAARGSGAVFGSKNLKAIAVRGEGKVNLADSEKFKELAREDREFFLKDKFQQEIVKNYGSHYGIVNWFPSYRNSEKYLSKEEIPEELTPEALKKYEIRRYACYGCVVACKDVYRIPEGEYEGEIGSGAEFELFHELGLGCGITKVVPILVAQNLCDKYGLDVMPLGYTIALAKDLYNRGIITKDDTQGLSLEWEDAESQIELIHQTALREGFGDKIAEGLYSFAKMVGEEAVKYCYHVKGLCRGGYPYSSSETVNLVYALSHATSTRGADHLRGRTWAYGEQYAEMFKDYQEKGIIPKDIPSLVVCAERAALIADILCRCKCAVNNWPAAVPLVVRYPLWDGVARLLSAATGLEFDEAKVEEVLDRIYTLERAFIVRQGITRKHDRLAMKPSFAETPEGGEDLKKHGELLTRYYGIRGWDSETGIPTRQTLERFGLKYVADELESHSSYPDWDGPPLWPSDKYPHGGKRA